MTCTQEELNRRIFTAYHMGLQPAIHAIGDLALDTTLTAIENAIAQERACGATEEELSKRLPFRIIHVQMVDSELVARMKKLPVVLDIQPIFLATDWSWIEKKLGKERVNGAYAWNTLQQAGLLLTGGSDCPVESYHPRPGIYAAVTRCGMDGQPENGYQLQERSSRFDAIALYTKNPHYATGQQNVHCKDCETYEREISEAGNQSGPFKAECSRGGKTMRKLWNSSSRRHKGRNRKRSGCQTV